MGNRGTWPQSVVSRTRYAIIARKEVISLKFAGVKPSPDRAPRTKRRSVHQVGEEPSKGDSEDSEISFVTASVDSVAAGERGERDAPITVCITLDGKPVTMEVDTGAAKTIMSGKTFRKLWPGRSLHSYTSSTSIIFGGIHTGSG